MTNFNTYSLSVSRRSRPAERGFSLITTLILLVVVTVLGISASQMVLLSERSSRFDRDTQIAFQAAEAALIDAELDIRGPNTSANKRVDKFSPKNFVNFIEGCGDDSVLRGMCKTAEAGQKPVWYQVDFTDQSASAKTVKFGEFTGREFAVGTTGIRPEQAPRYIIEAMTETGAGSSATSPSLLYRITSMGFGPRKETQVVLQIVFRKE